MHPYRTHTCGELTLEHKTSGSSFRLIHRKRDHGHLLFIDLRDHYGMTQCVIDSSNPLFKVAEEARLESVLQLGKFWNAQKKPSISPYPQDI